jgi:DOPA 4,5-dioxygenase
MKDDIAAIARDERVALIDPSRITGYHAHVYYQPATRRAAENLREAIGAKFSVALGRWHDQPVGPHPIAMYQVSFAVAEFQSLVPWLMLNHAGLSILIHPLTGDDLADHRDYPLWLGPALPLRLDQL